MDMKNTDLLDAPAQAGVVEEQRGRDPEVSAKARPPCRYTAAYKAKNLAEYEQRFVRHPPTAPALPQGAWINEPEQEDIVTTQ